MVHFERFGKYKLLERLGQGGMAEVFLALSPAVEGLYKLITIKKVLPELSANSEFVTLFKREARVVLNLNHANVLSIFDFGFKKGQYYLVMDYVQGCTLREILAKLKENNSRLKLEHILHIVCEIANGLDHAHNCVEVTTGRKLNIIHQDIKPENVMISYEGAVKIIDFGIAKADFKSLLDSGANQAAVATPIRGTAAYMSPEQILGQTVDGRSDIFSLGVMLWELITDQQLFDGPEESDVLVSVVKRKTPPVTNYNRMATEELNRIVEKSLMKNPHERFQLARTMFHELNKYLNQINPNYTSHHFSAYIRELTLADSQQSRNKIVEYTRRADLEQADDSANGSEPQDDDAEFDFSENPHFNFYESTELAGIEPLTGKSQFDFKDLKLTAAAAGLAPTPLPTQKTAKIKTPAAKPVAAAKAAENSSLPRYGVIALVVLLFVSLFGFLQYRIYNSKKQAAKAQEILSQAETLAAVAVVPKKVLKNAYLSISTNENNENNIILYIDGKKIFDRPPIAMLPVTAGRDFEFSALNILTKETVKFNLNLAEGEQKSLTVFP